MTLWLLGFGWALSSVAEPAKPVPAIACLKATPDGKGLLIGSQAGAAYRPLDGKDDERIETKLEQVLAFAFNADGSVLAVAGGTPAEKGIVELWSWPERKRIGLLEGHSDVVHDVVWLAKEKVWATASADRTIRTWDAEKRECVATWKGHSGPVFALAVSPDGKLICSASGDQTIRVWDSATGKSQRTLNNHLGAVNAMAFQPAQPADAAARLASVSDDGTLRVWQPDNGRLIRIVRQAGPVYALAWSGDGQAIATGGKDGKIRVFEGDSDKLLAESEAGDGRVTAILQLGDKNDYWYGDGKGNVKKRMIPTK